MILAFTFVVAFSILATGALVAILELQDATTDTTEITDKVWSVITALSAALLGLVAGQASSRGPGP